VVEEVEEVEVEMGGRRCRLLSWRMTSKCARMACLVLLLVVPRRHGGPCDEGR